MGAFLAVNFGFPLPRMDKRFRLPMAPDGVRVFGIEGLVAPPGGGGDLTEPSGPEGLGKGPLGLLLDDDRLVAEDPLLDGGDGGDGGFGLALLPDCAWVVTTATNTSSCWIKVPNTINKMYLYSHVNVSRNRY